MVQRLTYRRQNSYATRSNRTKIVKTPGGKLTYIYIDKKAGAPKCGDCGVALSGVRFPKRCVHYTDFFSPFFRSPVFALPSSTECPETRSPSAVPMVVLNALSAFVTASSVLS